MNDARTRVLARVQQAQRMAYLPAMAGTPRSVDVAPRSAEECLERFLAELTALGVEHRVEASVEDVREKVASFVEGRAVLSWDPEWLPYRVGSLMASATLGRRMLEAQANADVGITGCDAAIAETGSLVLLSGKGKSRTVSLLPPLHVAIVRPEDLFFSMAEFFRTRADRLAGAACCTVITGPSRTADIELTLTLGVHGPGKVVVVMGPWQA